MATVVGLKLRVPGKKLIKLLDAQIENYKEIQKRYRSSPSLMSFEEDLKEMTLFRELVCVRDLYLLDADDLRMLTRDPFPVRWRRKRSNTGTKKRSAAAKKAAATRKANAAKKSKAPVKREAKG